MYLLEVACCLLKIKKAFKDQLSIVAIAKNEGEYIKEWVEYHLQRGVDRIYIYDNDSTDNMHDILTPYIQDGRVIYTFFSGKARQLDAYNDAIAKYRHATKYMAFIDCDEFLCPENPTSTLLEVVESLSRKRRCGGVAVNWRMYGSSGFEKRQKGLLIENYLYRGDYKAKGSDCVKTIANPRLIKRYDHVHYPTYYRGFFNINEDGKRLDGWSNSCGDTKMIRINHYFTKSKEEWIERRSRGKADTTNDLDKRTLEEFYEHDHNDVYDPIMLRYVEKLKEKM